MNLPKVKKTAMVDMNRYTFLFYGIPKIGKTTLVSTFPDVLIASCEPGTKGLSVYEVTINNWQDIRDLVKALEQEDRFKTVAIDTIDRAYDFCLDYVCEKMGIDYPGEADGGKRDFGKSWREVKQEFIGVITRIINTGRGMIFTSHSQEMTFEARSGKRWDRIIPSMSKQARQVVEALVDVYFYIDYMQDNTTGENIRVMFCEGNETLWAGARNTPGSFPALLPMPDPREVKKGGKTHYEVILEGFNGQHLGIDPNRLTPVRETGLSASNTLRNIQKEATAKPIKPAVPKKLPPKKK